MLAGTLRNPSTMSFTGMPPSSLRHTSWAASMTRGTFAIMGFLRAAPETDRLVWVGRCWAVVAELWRRSAPLRRHFQGAGMASDTPVNMIGLFC